ncbi:Mitochondrial carrier domain [Pseudocohnilembus persalinus]|uniref:Mitochondrial carrier domain n=1 Tax=Pseudocohnilembus persalinus TaxID=266149 RepID=A0A0V0R8L9_PSEPJ|nr:Mitochondrial carrier domain [Pseudocohnilembus persalinus]|eukprot:KRX10817.1 Mitochondrial carrier domain [Pseudocohnilembus persalinus]
MANTVGPILGQLSDVWNSLTQDSVLESLTEFKGGQQQHNSWHVKYLRSEKDRVNNEYLALEKRFREEPEILDLANDNLLRLTVLAGFDRLVTLRQSLEVLKHRFILPKSNTGAFQEIANQGLRNGIFKGALLNAAQFLGVQYNTLLWARGCDFTTQLIASSVFEAFFHPLDTVKTILQADATGEFKGALDVIGRVTGGNSNFPHLFRGLTFKLAYNAFFLAHLRNFYEDSNWKYVTTPLWLLSYGFLAIKTRLQVAGTALSYQDYLAVCEKGAERGLYRGLVPFAAVNLLFSWQIYGLYSPAAQDKQVNSLRTKLQTHFSSPLSEERWV